jgi:hypothetical protein
METEKISPQLNFKVKLYKYYASFVENDDYYRKEGYRTVEDEKGRLEPCVSCSGVATLDK